MHRRHGWPVSPNNPRSPASRRTWSPPCGGWRTPSCPTWKTVVKRALAGVAIYLVLPKLIAVLTWYLARRWPIQPRPCWALAM